MAITINQFKIFSYGGMDKVLFQQLKFPLAIGDRGRVKTERELIVMDRMRESILCRSLLVKTANKEPNSENKG